MFNKTKKARFWVTFLAVLTLIETFVSVGVALSHHNYDLRHQYDTLAVSRGSCNFKLSNERSKRNDIAVIHTWRSPRGIEYYLTRTSNEGGNDAYEIKILENRNKISYRLDFTLPLKNKDYGPYTFSDSRMITSNDNSFKYEIIIDYNSPNNANSTTSISLYWQIK